MSLSTRLRWPKSSQRCACRCPQPHRRVSALTAGVRSRMELVVHFLGLLELYKQGLIELEQAATFGELLVLWTGGLFEATPETASGKGVADTLAWRQPASVSLADLDYRG